MERHKKEDKETQMTALQRWDPFRDLRQMQNSMDRIRRRFGTNTLTNIRNGEFEAWAIPLDVTQNDDDTVIRASLPGVAPDDINVAIEDNVLTIKGQTSSEQEEQGENYLMRERRTGSFHRALRLPDTVDSDNATPVYDNGVLTITIPKAESKKAKQLTVQVGNTPAIEAENN